MKQIDFLPPRYRERRTARNSHLWRLLVLAAFGAAVGAAAVGQQMLKRSAAAQVEAVDEQHALAQVRNNQFATLQRELAEVRASAQLYAYLKHPWPRTRILAMLAEALPREVALTDVSITRESLDDAQHNDNARPRRRREAEELDPGLLPSQRDLAQLREEFDKRRSIVRITGQTSSIDMLNQYIARLAASPLVARAELGSLESAEAGGSTAPEAVGRSEFHLQILVVAAHGQSERVEKSPDRTAARGADQ